MVNVVLSLFVLMTLSLVDTGWKHMNSSNNEAINSSVIMKENSALTKNVGSFINLNKDKT